MQEGVDVSITGNSTNPTRFRLFCDAYKKECIEQGKKCFSVLAVEQDAHCTR